MITRADAAADLVQHKWLTTAEAAAYTGRHEGSVRRAAAADLLESTQAGRGRGRRYRREWLDAWITGRPARRAS